MEAIPSASALKLGVANTLFAPCAAHAFRQGSGLPINPNLQAADMMRSCSAVVTLSMMSAGFVLFWDTV